jgi:rhamnose utilization protein RhaD (predicted bifunctional aldolase and dehydrogenase)
MKASIVNYCAAIGTDPMLVQGAGGNASWKDSETLWIKASGTWLSDAADKDIFVPVDLPHLQEAIASGDFEVSPKLRGESTLRPSIETLLHALMPHPVVVHLHAIEVLARLVQHDFDADITSLLGDRLRWTNVGYLKPGADLARAVRRALDQVPDADVVLLQNHGVVIGGSDVAEVEHILCTLIAALATRPRDPATISPPESPLTINGGDSYFPVLDPTIHQLATDVILFDRLSSDWALYPDHVVFLGARPACYASIDAMQTEYVHSTRPELVFIREFGVFAQAGFSVAKQAQLRCYYDVLSRQPEGGIVSTLSNKQIAELLNWDAEQYRMHLSK